MKIIADKIAMGSVLKILILLSLTVACAPKRQKTATSLKVHLGAIGVGATAEFNCLAVAVNYPEFVNGKSCTHNGITKSFHTVVGFYPRTSEINMNITVGPNRKFILYGLKSANGVCPSLGQNIMGDVNLSAPFFIGESVATEIRPIASETVNVGISYNAANEVDSCSGGITYEALIGTWDNSTWDSAAVWGP